MQFLTYTLNNNIKPESVSFNRENRKSPCCQVGDADSSRMRENYNPEKFTLTVSEIQYT